MPEQNAGRIAFRAFRKLIDPPELAARTKLGDGGLTLLDVVTELEIAHEALLEILRDHGGIHDRHGCLTCSALHDYFGEPEEPFEVYANDPDADPGL